MAFINFDVTISLFVHQLSPRTARKNTTNIVQYRRLSSESLSLFSARDESLCLCERLSKGWINDRLNLALLVVAIGRLGLEVQLGRDV